MQFAHTHRTLILAISSALLIAGSIFFWYTKSGEDDAARTIRAVAELVVVPRETPLVTTVTDPSKLSDTPLRGEAEVGDKVLFYTNAKRAILYRPNENRIVDMVRLTTAPPAQKL